MGFQIIWSILIVFAVYRLMVQFRGKRIDLLSFLFFLLVWSLVFFLNWNNKLLNKFGHLLGIERGATILVYIALFLLFYYVFASMIRFHKLEQDINRLVKKDAVESFLKKYNLRLDDKNCDGRK